jgi:hypothetical protein
VRRRLNVASGARFTVTDREEPKRLIDPEIKSRAETLRDDARSFTPRRTGTMAAGWQVVWGGRRAMWQVQNLVPYSVYVEFGTRHMRAQAPLGRARARQDRR